MKIGFLQFGYFAYREEDEILESEGGIWVLERLIGRRSEAKPW